MNNRPIEESNDSDLIGSRAAMERAAERAWQVARETDTKVVVEIDGKVVHLEPDTQKVDRHEGRGRG